MILIGTFSAMYPKIKFFLMKLLRKGVGYLAQEASVFRHMSVEDNIMSVMEMSRQFSKAERKDRLESLLDEFNLHKVRKSKGIQLSGGERQKIALLRATTKRGHILILDEATANYDQQSVVEYDQYISDISSAYDYVFLITHNIGELQLVDKVIVLDQGRLQEIVTPAEFMSKYEKHNEREDLFL